MGGLRTASHPEENRKPIHIVYMQDREAHESNAAAGGESRKTESDSCSLSCDDCPDVVN